MSEILLTVVAHDRPGIVTELSDVIKSHDASWLESNMVRLGGEFAGLVKIKVPDNKQDALQVALHELEHEGISVFSHASTGKAAEPQEIKQLSVIGNDRVGIVEEIATLLSSHKVNVEKISTRCEPAAMAGDMMFVADIKASLPVGMSENDLQTILESLSDDLMVEYDSE